MACFADYLTLLIWRTQTMARLGRPPIRSQHLKSPHRRKNEATERGVLYILIFVN